MLFTEVTRVWINGYVFIVATEAEQLTITRQLESDIPFQKLKGFLLEVV